MPGGVWSRGSRTYRYGTAGARSLDRQIRRQQPDITHCREPGLADFPFQETKGDPASTNGCLAKHMQRLGHAELSISHRRAIGDRIYVQGSRKPGPERRELAIVAENSLRVLGECESP